MTWVNVTLQSLHVLFAAFWLGSLLYTELILWPQLRQMGQLQAIQGELRKVQIRRQIGIAIVGTIITGFARGATAGVFMQLFSPYGVMFLSAALVGIATMVWWLSFPTRDRKIGWRLFYSSFVVLFALMIGMRFHSPA
jgi:uncharacterized membrane protein